MASDQSALSCFGIDLHAVCRVQSCIYVHMMIQYHITLIINVYVCGQTYDSLLFIRSIEIQDIVSFPTEHRRADHL